MAQRTPEFIADFPDLQLSEMDGDLLEAISALARSADLMRRGIGVALRGEESFGDYLVRNPAIFLAGILIDRFLAELAIDEKPRVTH